MFPDTYFPLDIAAFWQAVEGLPSHIIEGYLRALTYYWGHNHCDGLQDNSEFLRKVCRIESHQWEDACKIIFDNDKFFTLGEDQKWHQKRAKKEWAIAVEKYERASRGGRMTAAKRWGTKYD